MTGSERRRRQTGSVLGSRGGPDTHKLSVLFGYQDVHLGALGADDLAAEGAFAQVHLAAVRLVDGDGGHLPHDLRWETSMQNTVSKVGPSSL